MLWSSSARGNGNQYLEHEAVELRLGQRVGASISSGFCGQHEERPRQRTCRVANTDGLFLHRFEQRGLSLGCGAVDLVGQDQVGEDRPGLEAQAAPPVEVSLTIDVPTMSRASGPV